MQTRGFHFPQAVRRLLSVLFGAFVLSISPAGMASDAAYPTKPLRIVVPYAAGGTADAAARLIAQKLAPRVGQPVTVENKPGAGGIIGLQSALASPADGHTLVLIASGFEWLSAIHRKLPFDPATDFSPVAMIGTSPTSLSRIQPDRTRRCRSLCDTPKAAVAK